MKLNHSSGSFVTLEMEGQVEYIASGYTLCFGCVLQIWADEVGRPGSPCIQENCTVSRNTTAEIILWSIFACILMVQS